MAFIQQFFKDLRTPLYKNAIYLMMNMALGSGLGFFFWIIVARYHSPHEVGLAAAIIPIMVLIGILSNFGFEFGLVRYLPSSGEDSGTMINSCFTISGLAAICISFVFLMGLGIWSPALLFVRENWIFFLSFIVFSVVFSLYSLTNQVFVARRDTRFTLAGTSISGLRILFLLVFSSFFGVFGIFSSWSLAILISLAVGMILFIPVVNPGYRPIPVVRRSVVSNMLRFSAGNYAAGIFSAIPASLVPLVIVNTLGAESVAYYFIAFTVAGLLFGATGAIGMSLFAEGSWFEGEMASNVRKALKFVFALLTPAIIVVLLFGKHLLLLFGNEYSSEGLILLQVFALSSIFVALNGIFVATRRVLKRLKPILAVSAFNAFAVVLMGYAFLVSIGLVGIAIAWTLSQGIVSAGIGVYLLRTRREKRQYTQPEKT